MTHISAIPLELVMYIFKWVVSTELDMKSLEHLALVRRNFHAEFKTLLVCKVIIKNNNDSGKGNDIRVKTRIKAFDRATDQ